jgi:hypothetical protein
MTKGPAAMNDNAEMIIARWVENGQNRMYMVRGKAALEAIIARGRIEVHGVYFVEVASAAEAADLEREHGSN